MGAPSGSVLSSPRRTATRSERRETAWFEDHSSGAGVAAYGENLTSVDAFTWVPRGYAVVRVDERGTGGIQGPLQPFSRQEALDFYDVIEWVAAQDWCTGAVGLAAASYGATIQWNVARLRPPSLRAMIPWASDIDSYRELAYPGGILHEGYRNWWWGSVAPNITPGEVEPDFVQVLREHPLYDESFYGPDGDGPISAALDEIDLPFPYRGQPKRDTPRPRRFRGVPRVPVTRQATPRRRLALLPVLLRVVPRRPRGLLRPVAEGRRGGTGRPTACPLHAPHRARRVHLAGRAHLAAARRGATGAASRRLDGRRPTRATERGRDVDVRRRRPGPDTVGVSFLTPPFESDMLLVGHIAAHLTLSSSSHDADVFVSIDVVDTDGEQISFHVGGNPRTPISSGCLKASHRALDPERSRPERPWHQHGFDDVEPLQPGAPTQLAVELAAVSVEVAAGLRLRIDVKPVEGPGGFEDPVRGAGNLARAFDVSYHAGATNTVHTGPGAPSTIVFTRLSDVNPRGGTIGGTSTITFCSADFLLPQREPESGRPEPGLETLRRHQRDQGREVNMEVDGQRLPQPRERHRGHSLSARDRL